MRTSAGSPALSRIRVTFGVENKPLFIIYRAHKLPNIRKTTAIWRDECRRLGIGEVFLCRVDTG